MADFLTELGIELREVRVVADRGEAIATAVNALRGVHDHVFTTGRIGPTHDDITAESIAAAFRVPLFEDPRALEMMRARYGENELSPARRKMATVPQGSVLIANGATAAPGFTMENVHVLAGVPEIMRSMLVELTPTLRRGHRLVSRSIAVATGEDAYAAALAELQKRHPDVAIGSYPQITDKGFSAEIVLQSRDPAKLDDVVAEVKAMLRGLSIELADDPAASTAP